MQVTLATRRPFKIMDGASNAIRSACIVIQVLSYYVAHTKLWSSLASEHLLPKPTAIIYH